MFEKEIKKARKEARKTQKEVAKATNIPQPTISWIESGQGIPNILQCKLLADYYGISIDELIGREMPKNYSKNSITYNNSTHNGNNYQK